MMGSRNGNESATRGSKDKQTKAKDASLVHNIDKIQYFIDQCQVSREIDKTAGGPQKTPRFSKLNRIFTNPRDLSMQRTSLLVNQGGGLSGLPKIQAQTGGDTVDSRSAEELKLSQRVSSSSLAKQKTMTHTTFFKNKDYLYTNLAH